MDYRARAGGWTRVVGAGRSRSTALCASKRLMLWRLALVVGGMAFALACSAGYTARGATLARLQQVSHVELAWIGVDHNHPTVLYVGGSFACQLLSFLDPPCSDWALQSLDGGASWSDLRPRLGVPLAMTTYEAGDQWPVTGALNPVTVAGDQRHVYTVLHTYIPDTSTSDVIQVLWSSDNGGHWSKSTPSLTNAGDVMLFLSPASPTQVYAQDHCLSCGAIGLSASSDGGRRWHDIAVPFFKPGQSCCADPRLVPDAVHATTVYANMFAGPIAGLPHGTSVAVARSVDRGMTWTQVITPAETLPLQTFEVALDPRRRGGLVGSTADTMVPADRHYLSGDGGRTWRVATCPGDVGGQCPTYTVDDVFGAGAAYGFVPASPDGRIKGGIYRFHGSGPAEARLALSDHLPVRLAALLDVQAGTRAGDPIYLLVQGTHGAMQGLLYRSMDGGKTWRRLLDGVRLLPNVELSTPVSPVRSACCSGRFFPQTGHSLSGLFLAYYQRYGGLDTFGYPRTEPFTDTGHLAQYTDRFLLEQTSLGVRPAPLGRLLTQGRFFAFPTAPTGQYVPATGHSLSGAFLAYWRAHHGATLLGAPIAEPTHEQNGDGSRRTYLVQWCENGRLEMHPEQTDTRYQVQLGLVGKQALRQRGWLP